jgi:hypothetical protein
MSDLDATLDRLAARAWPALETDVRDGWWLRYNEGLHRRVNSVFPEYAGSEALDDKIAGAEAYRRASKSPPPASRRTWTPSWRGAATSSNRASTS